MKTVFRTDASVQIGTGHVMRCLTLADALRSQGAECTFVCRPHTGHMSDVIRQRGHHVEMLTDYKLIHVNIQNNLVEHTNWLGTDWLTDASETQHALGSFTPDWLVVDHYGLDYQWEKFMRFHCKNLMVIDDLADRMHECNLLLDQNLGRTKADYCNLTPHDADILVGPRYALLRPEFSNFREESLARRACPQLKNLLITLGGIDKNNVTGLVLNALTNCELPTELKITVVMGPNAPWLEDVKKTADNMTRPTRVLVQVEKMANLMKESDWVIGAAGGTVWELCTLGLATCTLAIAKNQEAVAKALKTAGATHLLNLSTLQEDLNKAIHLIGNKNDVLEMQTNSARICDGLGAQRVADFLMQVTS